MTRTRLGGLTATLGASLLLLGTACNRAKVQPGSQQLASERCARRASSAAWSRVDDAREGSTVALARIGDRTLALVADEDDSVLHTVDLTTGRELVTTPLAGVPSQVMLTRDGRVLVAIRDRNQVAVLEPQTAVEQPLEALCALDVPAEPVALAASPDDRSVLITSGWGRALTVIDGVSLQTSFRVALAREPRAVVVSSDGARAFVAHVVGSRMSAVDLRESEHAVRTVDMTGEDTSQMRHQRLPLLFDGSRKLSQRMGCQSFALAKSVDPPGRVFAPQVLVDPGNSELPASGYGDGQRAAEVASIGVIDEATGDPLDGSLRLRPDDAQIRGEGAPKECLLPRAALTDPVRKSLFVSCLGIDSVVEYDATSADPRTAERARWSVGAGPTGLALDRLGQRLVVWSQFDQALSIISLAEGGPQDRPSHLALSRRARSASEGDVALGRRLFHTSGDMRISQDGRSCASCHPDGRDDSLTWATPDGPRNTPMLAGRVAHTAPYGWLGSTESVETHLHQTFQRLRGRGLDPHEVAALDAFVGSLRGPSEPGVSSGPEGIRVARGRAVFQSAEAACATCHHVDGLFTDAAVHDVGSRARADREPAFDTPSLRFVSGTAPYFHDGRYRSLRELLVGADGKMGHTSQLPPDDLDALEAYLRTL